MTDTEIIDWIERDWDVRLEDVRGILNHYNFTLRQAVEYLIKMDEARTQVIKEVKKP